MRSTLAFILSASLASAEATVQRGSARDRLLRRQNGPVAPGTAADCTWYDTALSESYTCAFFEEDWGLTHEEFVDYVQFSLPAP